MEDPKQRCGWTDKVRDAISVLEDMDECRNLHRGAAVFIFFASAGLSVGAFFLIVDLFLLINDKVLTVRVSEYVASGIISLSWLMIIPMWIVAFLLIFVGLDAKGFMDLPSVTTGRLSKLGLDRNELHELRGALASRNWRHGHIFESVVADLTKGRSDS